MVNYFYEYLYFKPLKYNDGPHETSIAVTVPEPLKSIFDL